MSIFHGSSKFYTLQSTTPGHVQNMSLNVKESTNIESDTWAPLLEYTNGSQVWFEWAIFPHQALFPNTHTSPPLLSRGLNRGRPRVLTIVKFSILVLPPLNCTLYDLGFTRASNLSWVHIIWNVPICKKNRYKSCLMIFIPRTHWKVCTDIKNNKFNYHVLM